MSDRTYWSDKTHFGGRNTVSIYPRPYSSRGYVCQAHKTRYSIRNCRGFKYHLAGNDSQSISCFIEEASPQEHGLKVSHLDVFMEIKMRLCLLGPLHHNSHPRPDGAGGGPGVGGVPPERDYSKGYWIHLQKHREISEMRQSKVAKSIRNRFLRCQQQWYENNVFKWWNNRNVKCPYRSTIRCCVISRAFDQNIGFASV